MADGTPPLSYFNDLAKKYNEVWNATDWDSVMAMYTEDCFLISGGNPPAKGKEATRKLVTDFKESLKIQTLDHSYDDYIISGDIACCRGHFTLKGVDDKLVGTGNTMVIFRRENKKWLMHYDMFAM